MPICEPRSARRRSPSPAGTPDAKAGIGTSVAGCHSDPLRGSAGLRSDFVGVRTCDKMGAMATHRKNPHEDSQLFDATAADIRTRADRTEPEARTDEPAEPEESAEVEPLLTEIDHVAIAVHDLPAAIDFYRESFGAIVEHREIVDRDGVEEAMLRVAESYIQLVTPIRDDSPVTRYLERNGEGIHHVGYRVADCEAALRAYQAGGGRAIDERPRPGSRDTTVAFLHPKTSFGTLIELVQEPA